MCSFFIISTEIRDVIILLKGNNGGCSLKRNWTVLLSKENELFHVHWDALRKWCTGVGSTLIYRSATSQINWEKNLSSRGGRPLWREFGGHIKATGYLHNCSDLKNKTKKAILSGKWCRKWDRAGRDSDSQLWEINSHWTGIMIPDCEMKIMCHNREETQVVWSFKRPLWNPGKVKSRGNANVQSYDHFSKAISSISTWIIIYLPFQGTDD